MYRGPGLLGAGDTRTHLPPRCHRAAQPWARPPRILHCLQGLARSCSRTSPGGAQEKENLQLPPRACRRAPLQKSCPQDTTLDPALDHAEPSQVTTCCWMGLVWVGVTLSEAAQKPLRLGWPWQGLTRLPRRKEEQAAKTREMPEAQASSSWSIQANQTITMPAFWGGCLHASSLKVLREMLTQPQVPQNSVLPQSKAVLQDHDPPAQL